VSSSVARAKRLADGVRSAQTLAGIKHTHCAVLKLLRSLVSGKPVAESRPPVAFAAPPTSVVAEGVDDFNVTLNLIDANGLPVLDWSAAQQWVESIPGSQAQAAAWASCEQAWLENLRAALGSSYSLVVKDEVALLSSLEANVAVATIAFVAKMRQRIVRVLDGVAHVPEWGNDILVVFDEDDAYYRYVAHYYPEAGDFAASGGMFIHHGCGHFVTVKADLRAIEPVIAHELTHACLSHLPIPAWLNEGLAVNTEQRLCPPPSGAFSGSTSPHQMQSRHRKFWKSQEIRSSGPASHSYALMRAMNSHTTWPASWFLSSPATGSGLGRLPLRQMARTVAPLPREVILASNLVGSHARSWSKSQIRASSPVRQRGVAHQSEARSTRMPANPSLERTSTGMAPWPRYRHSHHRPRGQGATPVSSAQLKR
jgi:hypothetical protein